MYTQYFFLLFGIYIFFFLIDTLVDYLNTLSWSEKLPKEVAEIYDAQKYATQQSYEKQKYRFGKYASGFSFLVMVLILLLGWFGWLDEMLRSYFHHDILVSFIFFGILFLGQTLIWLPFSYYNTFVIEERYWFNKMTKKLFFIDAMKSLALTLIIWGILVALIVYLYAIFPQSFWIFTWIVLWWFFLFIMMFYSSLIVPLFNKQTPLEEGELKSSIFAFAKKVGFEVENIFVIDGSKRSSKANAYFSGFWPKKRIVLFDTLINDLTTDELVAVLAHEIGHYQKKHTIQMLLFSLIQTWVILYLFSLIIENRGFAAALGATNASFHIGLIAFSLLFTPLSFLLGMIGNLISRKNEYEADEYAKKYYSALPLIEGLKKLSKNNLSNLTPHPVYEFIHYTHPSVLKRIKKLQK